MDAPFYMFDKVLNTLLDCGKFDGAFATTDYRYFNPVLVNVPFVYPPENIRRTKVFPVIPGGVEKEH